MKTFIAVLVSYFWMLCLFISFITVWERFIKYNDASYLLPVAIVTGIYGIYGAYKFTKQIKK